MLSESVRYGLNRTASVISVKRLPVPVKRWINFYIVSGNHYALLNFEINNIMLMRIYKICFLKSSKNLQILAK